MRVHYKKTSDSAKQPATAHVGDAGHDLYVAESCVIPPHTMVDVPSHIAVELPSGLWGMITGRSSTLRKRGLMVNTGIIDNAYIGELYAGVYNLTNEPVEVEEGERLAQLILMPLAPVVKWVAVGELDPTERGTNGFGSSGL